MYRASPAVDAQLRIGDIVTAVDGKPVRSARDTLAQIAAALRECGQYAQPRGVPLRLEVHGEGTRDVRCIRTILDLCDHPFVSTCWNCNFSEVVGGSIAAAFALLEGRIGLVHTRDLWVKEYPWAELMRLLKSSGYEGFTLIEGEPAGKDPVADLRRQRALWEELQRG
jgi:sugar phosphate isomerase/epimerase